MTDDIMVDYERPPIAEVVAAVGFKSLPDNALAHFGAFWKTELASEFPKVEERPIYLTQIERFGRESLLPQGGFGPVLESYSPRLWFLSESGDELLQLQRNWFACNWRKVSSDAFYSHWPKRQEAFIRWFSALEQYVSANDLPPLEVEQCEVTYINHIGIGDVWKDHGDIHKILKTISAPQVDAHLEQEKSVLNQQYVVKNDAGRSIARLHVNVLPAFVTATREPIYVLELTVRGAPEGQTSDDFVSFFRRARNIIVTTFSDITTPEIQREWGIRDHSN